MSCLQHGGRERLVKKLIPVPFTFLLLMPRPHVSGDFCIRKFFYADTPSVHTCPPYTLGVSGNFCIRSPEWKFLYTLCIRIRVDARIRIFLYTLTSQYQNQSFSARDFPKWLFKLTRVETSSKQTRKPRIWRQNYRRLSFLCNAHALLTNPLRCPDTNRIRVDGRIPFVYATCGRRYFCIRIKKFADTKISGYVWTGHEAPHLYPVMLFTFTPFLQERTVYPHQNKN